MERTRNLVRPRWIDQTTHALYASVCVETLLTHSKGRSKKNYPPLPENSSRRLPQGAIDARHTSHLRLDSRQPSRLYRIVLNQVISIDLLWLQERPLLHIIDDHTGFRSAAFLKHKSASNVWNAFVACWVSTYIGFPNTIRTEQESAATSAEFRNYASLHGVNLHFSGVSSQNAVGAA